MLNRLYSISLVAALVAVSAPADAGDLQAELAAAGCVACHKMDGPLIGPGYKQVADKYRDDPAAAETLLAKVKEGGSGVWGQIPMAPNGHLPDDQLKSLVAGILAVK